MYDCTCKSSSACYCIMPHHAVYKSSSKTTKLRVVFNASTKTGNGILLNGSLMVGCFKQNNLF